ncbi:MAG: UDP-3-O-(3-hydroxymyristoyl)glucosamine N-acyltransferase [Anaerolineae bacterium]|nr:UDP-3-O-(3-hydroxymyristoyl)glucosamine N-acyltransferase [Anaerolineae bacterium]
MAFYDIRFASQLAANPDIACVVTTPELAHLVPERVGLALAADAKTAFYELHTYLSQKTTFYWRDFPTVIDASSKVHGSAYVAPTNVQIGPGCVVEAGAVIFEKTLMAEEVVIRAGAVIGGEGFEPKYVGRRHVIIHHAGGVRLHSGVEVQANSHIARAVFGGFTTVGQDSKIDALVHIAHDVVIGQRCEIAAGSIIGGSTRIGNEVWIGPPEISSEIVIGDGAFISLGAVVTRNVAPGQHVSGNFAIDHDRFLAFIKSIR